jgi:DNA polymerase III delta prime subunit
MSLSNQYHPESFDLYVNQKDAKKIARNVVEADEPSNPLLLHGPYGVGKTTLAAIIADEMLSAPKQNFTEIDCSKLGNKVVEKADECLKPKHSISLEEYPDVDEFKVVLLDELHNVDPRTQQKLRKIIEEGGTRHQIIIAVNDLEAIEPAIRSRCTPVKLQPLSDHHVRKHIEKVVKEQELDVSEGQVEKIVEDASGDIRRALNRLEGLDNVSR